MGVMPHGGAMARLPGHRRDQPLRSALLASLLPTCIALSSVPLPNPSAALGPALRLRAAGAPPAFVGSPVPVGHGRSAAGLCMSSRGRRKAQEGGAGKSGAGIGGSSSNMGVQRRHLGPTTEDLMSFRRAEREQRLKQIAAMRAQPMDAEGDAAGDGPADLEGDAPVAESVGLAGAGGEGKRRHLGPTLEEIAEMRTLSSASFGQVSHKEREIEFAPRAAREPSEDAPTQVQLNALIQNGVGEDAWPQTKSEASEMLREIREARLGNDLMEVKGPAVEGKETRHLTHEADARDVVREYAPKTPKLQKGRVHDIDEAQEGSGSSHLQYALKGISTIRRKGSVQVSIEQLEA